MFLAAAWLPVALWKKPVHAEHGEVQLAPHRKLELAPVLPEAITRLRLIPLSNTISSTPRPMAVIQSEGVLTCNGRPTRTATTRSAAPVSIAPAASRMTPNAIGVMSRLNSIRIMPCLEIFVPASTSTSPGMTLPTGVGRPTLALFMPMAARLLLRIRYSPIRADLLEAIM